MFMFNLPAPFFLSARPPGRSSLGRGHDRAVSRLATSLPLTGSPAPWEGAEANAMGENQRSPMRRHRGRGDWEQGGRQRVDHGPDSGGVERSRACGAATRAHGRRGCMTRSRVAVVAWIRSGMREALSGRGASSGAHGWRRS
jgi:hypothetical protein